MYKVKAFQGVGDNPPHRFSYGSLKFEQARFSKDELIAFLDDLLAEYPQKITLSIRLDNIHQLGDKENSYTDVILEVTSE